MRQKQVIILFSSLLFLILIAGFVRSLEMEDASDRIVSMTLSGPGFAAREIPLTEFESDMLGEAAGYKWLYSWKGLRYAITILDGTRNRQAVHDPRYCFRGAGWRIDEDSEIPFSGGTARFLELSNESGKSEALFFYTNGEVVFDAPLEYWLRATARRWLRGYGGEESLLVMLQPLDSGVGVMPAVNGLLPMIQLP